MANFNKVILIGRLTRDPETRTFGNGGKVAKVSFAVTNRKKNGQTGQWEDEPMYIDIDFFNRGEFGKMADQVGDRLHKGSQICVEGKLHLETWDDKTTGQKRSKHKLVAENFHYLDPRQDGGAGGGGGYGGGAGKPAQSRSGGGFSSDEHDNGDGPPSGGNEDIPF